MQKIDEIYRARLQLLIDEIGSQAKLSQRIWKSPAQISQWINASPDSKTGKPRVMDRSTAREIERLFPKPEGWMDQPIQTPFEIPRFEYVKSSEEVVTQKLSNVAPVPMGVTRIPLISYVQAGMWTAVEDNFQPGDADDWLMTDLRMSSHAFALEIKGDSMLPEFKPGDRVIIDPEVAPQPGDFVVAKNGEDEATFKKYRPRGTSADGNMIFDLVPLNEDFPSIRSDAQPLRIVGTMVEHRKYRRTR